MFLWRTGENYPRIIIKYSSLSSPLEHVRQFEHVELLENLPPVYLHVTKGFQHNLQVGKVTGLDTITRSDPILPGFMLYMYLLFSLTLHALRTVERVFLTYKVMFTWIATIHTHQDMIHIMILASLYDTNCDMLFRFEIISNCMRIILWLSTKVLTILQNLFTVLTLKAPRKSASENVVCLCRLLHLLANFSKLHFAYRQTVWTKIRLLLKEQSDLGPHCLQQCLLK